VEMTAHHSEKIKKQQYIMHCTSTFQGGCILTSQIGQTCLVIAWAAMLAYS